MHHRKLAAVFLAGCLLLAGCGPKTEPVSSGGSTESSGFGSDWKPIRPEGGVTPAQKPEGFMNGNQTGVLNGLTGLNFIDDTTPWPEVSPVAPEDAKDRVPGQPYVVNTTYDDGMGLCVALYNVVEDFNAANDGSKSASGQIQQALLGGQKGRWWGGVYPGRDLSL